MRDLSSILSCSFLTCTLNPYHTLLRRVVSYRIIMHSIAPGKRRYDRKQSGYGGQTKPVFHKKVFFPCPFFIVQ